MSAAFDLSFHNHGNLLISNRSQLSVHSSQFKKGLIILQQHFIANHLKFTLNCIRYLFLLSFPRKRESSLFLDITGVLDARLRGHDVKK